MARMSIDDKVLRDPRITALSKTLRWSRRETLGCLVSEVWPICYDQATHLVSERMIDLAADCVGFAKAMVECELATRDRSGKVAVAGAKERIRYLDHKIASGREGGLKSAETRRKGVKQTSSTTSSTRGSTPQAEGNPNTNTNTPANPPAPDTVNTDQNSATPSAGGTPDLFGQAPPPPKKQRARNKPSEPTADEREIALWVLAKLGQRSGVSYSGTTEHVRLIVNRLRSGTTEEDLRKVIGYCAVELKWQGDPDQEKYLRPETLFGPKTISKYLDPARSWFAKNPGLELERRPSKEAA